MSLNRFVLRMNMKFEAEIPPRVEYSLTKDGRGLREAVIPILKWAATRKCSRKKCSATYNKIPAHRIRKQDVTEKCDASLKK